MNDDELNDCLRQLHEAPSDTSRAEYGFETRLLARIRSEKDASPPLGIWAWRLSPLFLLITAAALFWASPSTSDTTLNVAVTGLSQDWEVLPYMTGHHL